MSGRSTFPLIDLNERAAISHRSRNRILTNRLVTNSRIWQRLTNSANSQRPLKQLSSTFSAVPVQFQCNSYAVQDRFHFPIKLFSGQFSSSFSAVSEQFPSSFSAVPVQFQCGSSSIQFFDWIVFRANPEQFQCGFSAIPVQFQCSSSAVPVQFPSN